MSRSPDKGREPVGTFVDPVDEEIQVMEGIGRFSWASDPEGNRFELWEPTPEALKRP